MTEKKMGVSLEEAEKAIEAERRRRANLCQAAIAQALQEHGFELVGVPGISADGRIVTTIQLQPAS